MILYYALGGGLGHLTRGRRVLETLGVEATFVTASAYASDPRVTGRFDVVRVPAELEGDVDAHREWLRALPCDRLIVDTFPCGIQGELSGLDVPMELVARRLKWDEYRRAVPHPLPQFQRVWVMEEMEPFWSAATASCRFRYALDEQRHLAVAALLSSRASSEGPGRAGRQAQASCPTHPGPSLDARDDSLLPDLMREKYGLNFSLIVHSGPAEEVDELVAYARELTSERVLVATRCDIDLPDGFERIDAYPVTYLFPNATRIISAAGFNVMLETEPYRDKHHVVPFARRFDDQFARAASRRMSSVSPASRS